jgi:CubicO group peptidase (beta-lactamase class C family)
VLNADLERRWTLDDQLDLLADLPPSGEPGTFGSDGDTGIKLLAYIVEQETGSTLAELVAERVTTPLGLEGTVMPQDGDEPAGYQQGGFVFADESAVDTSMFPHIAFNTWSLTVDSTVTDVADLVDAWATGALFTTDRSATPGHFLASRPDDGAAAGAFGHPAVIGDHIPINGFCPCTLDGDLVSVTAVGRAPNTVGGDTVAWRFVADDVTIVLRVNSSEATDRSQIRAVVDAIHNAVAAA